MAPHLQYYNHQALLLVNGSGQLKVLYVPFRVVCTTALSRIPIHTHVFVEEVLSSLDDQLYFVVWGEPYIYKCFKLAINF